MQIAHNSVVSLHYTLRKDNANGEMIEETFGSKPLEYIHGIGMMISGFEKNLLGKSAGDTYAFTLAPDEAYGMPTDDNFVEVPIENFKDQNGLINHEMLVNGAPIHMSDDHGHIFDGFIMKVSDNTVTVDFNHMMAGMTLHFSGEILSVREATTSELDHGHVHGEGHEHHH